MGFGVLRNGKWLAAGVLLAAVGAAAIVRADIAERRERFQAEARTAHRVLSQAATRLEAVLGTLVLLGDAAGERTPELQAQLPALHPAVLQAWRRDAAHPWPAPLAPALAAAEAASQALEPGRRHAVLAATDPASRQYLIVLAGAPASFALRVDAARLASADEWPWPAGAPVRVTLTQGDRSLVLMDGASPGERPVGLTPGFAFAKPLAAASQPFLVQAQRFVGPAQWPWGRIALWLLACAAGVALARRWHLAREERRRARERMRLAQVARLNTMGELAAGMAHELNQPLTAVLAGTQAALRVLRDEADPATGAVADAGVAVEALTLAAGQARRAADVVARLRRMVQPPAAAGAAGAVDLPHVARHLLDLLGPELAARAIHVEVAGAAGPALADAVAVEQVLHNLLTNAMQALEAAPAGTRRTLTLAFDEGAGRVRCAVRDNGPGIAPEALPRLFEPFFTTRAGGLGLGLPLCQSLVLAMDGRLEARTLAPHGAEFVLELPAARAPAAAASPVTAPAP